jgi:uncharacterized protein with NRDE domain
LIAIHRGVRGAPLIVAANRDEYYDRPAEGPAIRALGDAKGAGTGRFVVAPLDLRAGGTWLGVNAEGVFAAITNLRNERPDPLRGSRGLVVMNALREPTAARAADVLKALPEESYNPFQCFVADREQAYLASYRDRPSLRSLAPGAHVIGNVDPGEEPATKAERIRERVERIEAGSADDVLRELAAVCGEHETGGGGLGDTCVHLGSYGTRSSVLFAQVDGSGMDEAAGRLLYSNGAPCGTEYEDHSALLRELRRRASTGTGDTVVRNGS